VPIKVFYNDNDPLKKVK
jgi:hypothetical protein